MFLTNDVQDASEAPAVHPMTDARGRQRSMPERTLFQCFATCLMFAPSRTDRTSPARTIGIFRRLWMETERHHGSHKTA